MRAQRRLEQTVVRLRQCLDDLGDGTHRVLALRAGLGPGDALSRAQVARRLALGVRRVVQIERSGLRRLDTLGDAGACGGTAGAMVASAVAPALLDGGGFSAPAVGEQSDTRPRLGVAGVAASGGGRSGAQAPPPPIGPGSEATGLILVGLLLTIGLLVRRELSRR